MKNPYNKYIEDKIKTFMKLIFECGYNVNELTPIFNTILESMRTDMINGTIATYEYMFTSSIIENLYLYVKRVCDNLTECFT